MVAQVWVRWCTRLQPLPRLTERSLGCSLTPRAVSGHGQRTADELRDRHPRVMLVHIPVHASWLNQIEIYFSIIQRKVLTPNDCTTRDELAARIHAFGQRYSALDKPFAWRFTRQNLEQLLKHPDLQLQPLAACLPLPDRARNFRDSPLSESIYAFRSSPLWEVIL